MENLGEGLNSVVYKAVRSDPFQHLNQTVAIKILKSKKLVDIWKNEFASLQKVVCKHCVRVYGFEWVGDRPALVLEYVDGITLRQLCLEGPVPKPLAGEILAQIQVGLRSLQAQGLCHGDLSPNNVMIDGNGLVRLLDFGWANNIEGRVQTTHAFAAREILSGGKPNFESDLYSLGCLEKLLLQRRSRRLSDDPSLRKPFERSPSEALQNCLAEYVRNACEQQNRLRAVVTKSIALTKRGTFPIGRFCLILLMSFCLTRSQFWADDPVHFGRLQIRTKRWMQIKIDGQPVGFTPQDLWLNTKTSHLLSWESEKSTGRWLVRLSPKESKILREKDLEP